MTLITGLRVKRLTHNSSYSEISLSYETIKTKQKKNYNSLCSSK